VTKYVTFEGRIEPLVWGNLTYTIVRLPQDIAASLTTAGAKRVEGEMAEHPVNLALSRGAGVEGVFLWAGKSLLGRTSLLVGDTIEVRLRPAPDDLVDTPEDILAALHQGDAMTQWDCMTSGKRRGLIYKISTAKTAPTRAKRVASLIADLLT
jgi:Bacteriocin-protection, YdeI or OmpD-Associated/Domain of unknown function (DUF1905)